MKLDFKENENENELRIQKKFESLNLVFRNFDLFYEPNFFGLNKTYHQNQF